MRQIVGIGDLEAFSRFVRLCAGRHAQLLNLSSLAVDCGVTHTTARRWLSVLEASFIVTLLRPYHRNFDKRLIKAPKLYFLDSGLVSFLLDIRSPKELVHHAMRGAMFEGFVMAELTKRFTNAGEIREMGRGFGHPAPARARTEPAHRGKGLVDVILCRGRAGPPRPVPRCRACQS